MSPILSQLTYYLAIFGGLIAALFMGSWLGSESYSTVIMAFLLVGGLMWIVLSGEGWWVPMMFAVGIGGLFYVPFKLYPHEIALGICGVALLPRIPFKLAGLQKDRPRPSPWFFALLGYLLIHFAATASNYWSSPGLGNVARAYMNALWPLLFGLGYYYYGSIRQMRPALRLLYTALLIRMGLGLLNYYTDDVFVIPGINYSIDPQDLRASGYMLFALASLMLISTSSPIAKCWHAFWTVVSAYALLLGGSRAQVAGVIVLCFVLFVIFRKWLQVVVLSVGVVLILAIINISPSVIEPLPYRVQRALSVLIIGSTPQVDVQMDVKGSDQFREVISKEGYNRWTESTKSIVLGYGIRPFDENATLAASRFEVDAFTLTIQSSADVGAYETSLWTILAVVGGAGMLLYIGLNISLIRDILPAIRAGHLRGGELAICAWAACTLLAWFFTNFLYGGFPSLELFLGLMAKAVVEDRRAEMEEYVEANKPVFARPVFQPLPGGRPPVMAGMGR